MHLCWAGLLLVGRCKHTKFSIIPSSPPAFVSPPLLCGCSAWLFLSWTVQSCRYCPKANLCCCSSPASCSGFLPRDRASRQLEAERGKRIHRYLNLQLKTSFSKNKWQCTGLMSLSLNSHRGFVHACGVPGCAYMVILTAGLSLDTARTDFNPN